MSNTRDTYKYVFKVGNTQVHCGFTDDLDRRENEHKNSGRYKEINDARYYWKNGHILQVGNITTREAAMQWERENNCNANWS